ncbi:MAG: permease [Proteobacteria bacterium]|nr:permease [Pseudomonadota bacterium]
MQELISKFLNIIYIEISKMWVFTFISIIIASLIKTYQIDLKIRFLMQKKIKTGILFATFAGLVSPLCSCGILPIAISLSAAGVPLPPITALLFTSPAMGPEALVLTYGGLGIKYALVKLIFATIFGIIIGFVFLFLQRLNFYTEDAIRIKPVFDERGELLSSYQIACANDISIKTMNVIPRESRFRFFLDRFYDMALFIGGLTFLAIVIEALLHIFISQDILKSLLSYSGMFSVLITAFIGGLIPLNQIAFVPIAKGLQSLGASDAVIVTLMFAGPTISIPSIIVLYKMFKWRVFITFVTVSFLLSLVAGLIFLVI